MTVASRCTAHISNVSGLDTDSAEYFRLAAFDFVFARGGLTAHGAEFRAIVSAGLATGREGRDVKLTTAGEALAARAVRWEVETRRAKMGADFDAWMARITGTTTAGMAA